MNIEDVKQLSDDELNKKLSKLTGFTDKYTQSLKDNGCWSPRRKSEDIWFNYTYNLGTAREAQAKAMSKDFEAYIYNLGEVLRVHEEHFVQVDLGYTSGIQHVYIGAVAHMLQATPRQICEAAYLMLMEVQSNGRI